MRPSASSSRSGRRPNTSTTAARSGVILGRGGHQATLVTRLVTRRLALVLRPDRCHHGRDDDRVRRCRCARADRCRGCSGPGARAGAAPPPAVAMADRAAARAWSRRRARPRRAARRFDDEWDDDLGWVEPEPRARVAERAERRRARRVGRDGRSAPARPRRARLQRDDAHAGRSGRTSARLASAERADEPATSPADAAAPLEREDDDWRFDPPPPRTAPGRGRPHGRPAQAPRAARQPGRSCSRSTRARGSR